MDEPADVGDSVLKDDSAVWEVTVEPLTVEISVTVVTVDA